MQILEPGGGQFFLKIVLREQAHLECRAGAAMKHQVVADFERAFPRPIDQYRLPGKIDNRELVQTGEPLVRRFPQRERHAHAEHAVRLEQFIGFVKSAIDRSGDVLEHVARQDEVVGPIPVRVRFGDIEPRLAIVVGIGVIEFRGELAGVTGLIAETQSLDGGQGREVGKKKSLAKELG